LIFGPLSIFIWNLGLKKYTSTGTWGGENNVIYRNK
jgi:hypothetical protein